MEIGLGTLLTIIFVVLKLTHNIDWDWIWVLSPLWISFILSILFLVLFGTLGRFFLGGRR